MKWPALTAMMMALSACATLPSSPYQKGQHVYDAPDALADKGIEHYLLYLPDRNAKRGKKWPLLVFLHGSGERGTDINQVKVHGPPKEIAEGRKLPFIIASPQLSAEQRWDAEAVASLIDDLTAKLPVDTDRIYLTGLSLGAYGTWDTAMLYPNKLAAIIPIAGRGDTDKACALTRLPIWAIHGAEDDIVPPSGSIDMVNAIRACGGDPRLTLYPGVGHVSWTEPYSDDGLYDWLLRHRRP